MKKTILTSIITLLVFSLFAQTPIELADNTLKVGGLTEESFYYGFAKGDKIIFSFNEVKGKKLKEVEIIEMPGSSKFMDFKTKKIDKKEIIVTKDAIYKFKFSNSTMARRICKFHITRIPANKETQDFNSTVYFKTEYDTSYYTIQERYLKSKDTTIHNITDQVAKVHSMTNLNGNKTTFNFTLPKNTMSWSYYVGVNQEGSEAFQEATKTLALKAGPRLLRIPGYGPLAALALGGVSYIANIQKGEEVDFYIVQGNENKNLFLNGNEFYYIKKGKVINDFSKMSEPTIRNLHFCLYNNNAVTAINVTVKVTAIVVNEVWDLRPVEKMKIKSRETVYLKND